MLNVTGCIKLYRSGITLFTTQLLDHSAFLLFYCIYCCISVRRRWAPVRGTLEVTVIMIVKMKHLFKLMLVVCRREAIEYSARYVRKRENVRLWHQRTTDRLGCKDEGCWMSALYGGVSSSSVEIGFVNVFFSRVTFCLCGWKFCRRYLPVIA